MGDFNFLKKKYNLHNTPEVKLAAKRREVQTGEKVSQNPEAQRELLEPFQGDNRQKGSRRQRNGYAGS